MTGIEHLREFVRTFHGCPSDVCRYTLTSIADQISREQADRSDEVAETFRREVSEAYAWVRDHGGLEAVSRMFQDADSRRVELCGALGIDLDKGWSEAMADMRPRLMPEGMECLVEAWPRFEDGGPVRIGDTAQFGDDVMEVVGVELNHFGYVLHGSINDGMRECVDGDDYGVAVRRPAPKVFDADGVEIRVGDEVWTLKGARELEVTGLYPEQDSCPVKVKEHKNGAYIFPGVEPSDLTHRAPVLAADGRPLREGETVYRTDSPAAFVIDDIMTREDGATVVHLKDGAWHRPQDLTHERPDSWERLEEDAKKPTCDYFGHPVADGLCEECPSYTDSTPQGGRGCRYAQMADLVRRAKALAGDAK